MASFHPYARRVSLAGKPLSECNLHATRNEIQTRLELYCKRTNRRVIKEYTDELRARLSNDEYVRWMKYGIDREFDSSEYISVVLKHDDKEQPLAEASDGDNNAIGVDNVDADQRDDKKQPVDEENDEDEDVERPMVVEAVEQPTQPVREESSKKEDKRKACAAFTARRQQGDCLSMDEMQWFNEATKRCTFFETQLQINYVADKNPLDEKWRTNDEFVIFKAHPLRCYILCNVTLKEGYKSASGEQIMQRYCLIIRSNEDQCKPCFNVKDVRIQARKDLVSRKEDGMKRWFWEVGDVRRLPHPKVSVDAACRRLGNNQQDDEKQLPLEAGTQEYEKRWTELYSRIKRCVDKM